MPELPDVETMRRYLQATSLHQRIEEVELHSAGYLLYDHQASRSEVARRLKTELPGRSFSSTSRHGKWLFVALNGAGELNLALHFGMTGGLKYYRNPAQEPEYTRMLFRFDNGYQLAYISMRKLGAVRVTVDTEVFIEERELGPDALDPDFDFNAFKRTIADRDAMIKALFLDQKTIAGIGNVYADEILFQAGVHPRTTASRLDDEELEAVYREMNEVLRTAIERQAQPGDFPSTYIAPSRHGDGLCPLCGAELETVRVASRSSYFCPNRQHEKEG